jgi:ABC-type bacteriocin/lantibiotic exporter with double-glycine peptidase domain
MSQKVDKNKTYIAVNIAENSNGAVRRTFLSRFRRNASTNDKKDAVSATPRLNKTDLARLLSLAKPEKWKLIGAICLLLVSSTVTMSIPFSLGKVLDIIYKNGENMEEARSKLNKVCGVLICIFVLGAICNFGRVYLMSVSGESPSVQIS